MDAVGFAREQLRQANEYLEQVMQDVTDEQAHWLPPGTALPIGAQYAHIVTGADGYVNGFLRESQPLFAGQWAGNVGVSALPPTDGADPSWAGWARSLRVDLPALRRYAGAVNACIDSYLASLTPGEMKADDEQQMVQRLGPYSVDSARIVDLPRSPGRSDGRCCHALGGRSRCVGIVQHPAQCPQGGM